MDFKEYNLNKLAKDDPDTHGWSYSRMTGYKCVDCGREVSPAVVKFFNHEVNRLKCYSCQNKPTF